MGSYYIPEFALSQIPSLILNSSHVLLFLRVSSKLLPHVRYTGTVAGCLTLLLWTGALEIHHKSEQDKVVNEDD